MTTLIHIGLWLMAGVVWPYIWYRNGKSDGHAQGWADRRVYEDKKRRGLLPDDGWEPHFDPTLADELDEEDRRFYGNER